MEENRQTAVSMEGVTSIRVCAHGTFYNGAECAECKKIAEEITMRMRFDDKLDKIIELLEKLTEFLSTSKVKE